MFLQGFTFRVGSVCHSFGNRAGIPSLQSSIESCIVFLYVIKSVGKRNQGVDPLLMTALYR